MVNFGGTVLISCFDMFSDKTWLINQIANIVLAAFGLHTESNFTVVILIRNCAYLIFDIKSLCNWRLSVTVCFVD